MYPRRRTTLRRYGLSATDRLAAGLARARVARDVRSALVRVPATPPAMRAFVPLQVQRVQSGRFQAGSAREVKCFDCAPVAPAAGIAWNLVGVTSADPGVAFVGMTCLNAITQGAGVYQRVGNKILMRNIRLRGFFGLATAADVVTIRMSVVYDRQPNGAYPAIGAVYANATSGATTQSVGLNISNVRRFTPLRDQFMEVSPAKSLMVPFDWFIPCRLQSEFSASAGSITDITTGSLLLIISMFLGTAGSVVTFGTGGITSRIRYDDS